MGQKICNVLGVLGFVMSAGMVAGSALLYTRIPALTSKYISELKLELTETLTNMLPGQVDGLMPEMPSSTGPAVPFKSPF